MPVQDTTIAPSMTRVSGPGSGAGARLRRAAGGSVPAAATTTTTAAAVRGDALVTATSSPVRRAPAAPPGLGPVLALTADWVLSPAEECALLGATSSEMLLAWRRRSSAMPAEAVTRVTLLRELTQLLRSPETGLAPSENDWLRTPRTEAPFVGRTPLALMLAGGAAAMAHVRRYLEGAARMRATATAAAAAASTTRSRSTRKLSSPAA